jgi:peptide deformylase
MWPDGVCRVTDKYYTKTIQFQDINYQLAQNEDKTSIFEGWTAQIIQHECDHLEGIII